MTSEKQVLCQSKTQPCMKNAQLRRTLQKLVKPAGAVFPAKFKVFKLFSESIGSSLQVVNIRARVNDDCSFPWCFGTETFSQVAGVLT